MRLTHQNITIRDAAAADAPLLAAWWNDGAVMAHAGFPNGLGITAEAVAADLAADTDGTGRHLILLWEGMPIGEIAYRNSGGSTADIGIKICEPGFQERGIGRTALSLLIQYLFDSGYAKITLDTNLRNARARHVYESLGFQQQAIHIDSWQNQLGQWESSVDYCLTPDSFVHYAV